MQRWGGGEIIIAKEHITHETGGAKNVWHGHVCKSQEQQDGGGSALTSEKGRLFIYFLYFAYAHNIKPNIYIVFVYVQSDTLTHASISDFKYSKHANDTVGREKNLSQWFLLQFTLNSS